ncbi:MAG: histidine kinase, partial [Lachnospiraceae bacterium]|nr:histidine kinase [Lachnospiraceae bacterium]
ASITVLEMRPHFIYNTMTSIYYLCKQDPDKAQQVILNFNNYLRKNFTAIVKENTIPFHEELEHTQAYLAVEQVRYENMIVVHYDTPHTSFRLPPLTLQPIVENAVKYGVDPDAEPLNIHIQTRKTEHGSEIIIKNNGSSFIEYGDKEPHIALNNIRERLTLMCHGTLTIGPLMSGGTIVTIQIPNS